MVNFVIALEGFGICLTAVALFLLLNGEGAREQKLLIMIMCGSLVQNLGYLLELLAPTVEAAMTAVTMEKMGSAFTPLCYCWFICIYCSIAPPKVLLRSLGVVSLLSLPTVICNWNGLFYREVRWVAGANGFYHVDLSYGPLYVFFTIAHIIIPYVLCICTLLRAIRERSDRQVNRQYWTILAISTLPVIVLIAYVFKLLVVFDFTPVTLMISMAMVVIVIWSRRNYVLILDMTHIKAYINEIKRVRRQAEKASIAKSEFLANMSHEIRTPMNAIIGLNDVIMEECGDTELYGYAKDVQSAAKNLLTIINDILDLSKVEAGKMELVKVNYYVKVMVDEILGR